MVNKGDRVRVNNQEARVTGFYGAGRHVMFTLDDGRHVLALDKLIASGQAQIVAEPKLPSFPKDDLEPLPYEDDDLED